MRAPGIVWQALKQLPVPLLAATALGWLLMTTQSAVPAWPTLCLSSATSGANIAARLSAALSLAEPSAIVLASAAMLLAMMPPLLGPAVLHVRHRSLTRRYRRAIALFAIGYAGVWLGVALLLTAAALLIGSVAAEVGWPALAIAVPIALAWQSTPLKQACLNRCHRRPPLAASGYRADADALGFGITHGAWCAGACCAWMLLVLTSSGSLHWAMMLTMLLLSIHERTLAPKTALWAAAWPPVPQPGWPRPIWVRLPWFSPHPVPGKPTSAAS